MEWYLVGAGAALLTTFGFVPQVIKMLRTKSVKDISLPTFVQFTVGMSLWALYGLHLGDPIIISANATGVAILIIAIALYLRYTERSVKGYESRISR